MVGLLTMLLGLFAVRAAISGSGNGSPSLSAAAADRIEDTEDKYAIEDAATVFFAAEGQLVLEADSGAASGNWSRVSVDGEQGMLWNADGNSYQSPRDGEELSFDFVIEENGTYYIALHAGRFKSAQDPGDVRDDTGNDAWVKMINLETGDVVLGPIKLFTVLGESDRELRWGKTFDANHEKSDAKVSLEGDTAYRLELIGGRTAM